MLKLSNFLQIDNLIIFKEKCLSNNSPKIWDFIAYIEKNLSDENIIIEQKVRNILGVIFSDISILNFLLENILDYDSETAIALQYFVEEAVDDKDKTIIFEKLVEQGIESIVNSQIESNNLIFENIQKTLIDFNQEHLIKDEVIYFVEGNFLICYLKDKGFNFEYFDKEYSKISDFLDFEKIPVVDKEYTELLFMNFTFENDDWLEDIYALTEAHYNELGEDYEHSNLYGELPNKLIMFTELDHMLFEPIFIQFANLIKNGYDLLNNVFYQFNDNEKPSTEEENKFNTNYPFKESFDELLMEMQHNLNQIYLNYIQQFPEDKEFIEFFDNIIDSLNNTPEEKNIDKVKSKLFENISEFSNQFETLANGDYNKFLNIFTKYFTFIDNISKEQFNSSRFLELLQMWNYNENENLSVWVDSYLTLE